jgi:hypothetical protein
MLAPERVKRPIRLPKVGTSKGGDLRGSSPLLRLPAACEIVRFVSGGARLIFPFSLDRTSHANGGASPARLAPLFVYKGRDA